MRALLVLVLLLGTGALAGAAVPRVETQPYVGTGTTAAAAFAVACSTPTAYDWGAACFALDGSETKASILVQDRFAPKTSAMAAYYGSGGQQLATTPFFFCNRYDNFATPPGAAYLVVAVTAPAGGSTCNHVYVYATTGTVQVSFG